MPYNYSKLAGKIKERYGTQGAFAVALNLSERSMSLKMRGERPWKQQEIAEICNLLKIDHSEISDYFFALEVQT